MSEKDYSQILLEFIDPIRDENDTEEILLTRLRIGRVAWNHCIAEQYDLPAKEYFLEQSQQTCAGGPNLKSCFEILVKRKFSDYDDLNFIILSVEINNDASGSFLYVQAVPLEAILHPSNDH